MTTLAEENDEIADIPMMAAVVGVITTGTPITWRCSPGSER